MKKIITVLILYFSIVIAGNEAARKSTKIEVGQQVPDFYFITIASDSLEIGSLKGKVVLLNFFATWCPPCRQELPKLESQLWNKYHDRGLQIFCIGREHDMQEMKAFANSHNYSL